MINLSIISDINKTVNISSIDTGISQTNFSNSAIHLAYSNMNLHIGTNLDTVSIENIFSGIHNIGSVNSISYFIIVGCMISSIYIAIKILKVKT